jgi:hypothetical protein
MWKNTVQQDRPQMTIYVIRRMRFACWITKATDTHAEYVILISFPLQQWLYGRASVLGYTYIACIVVVQLGSFRIRIVHVHWSIS